MIRKRLISAISGNVLIQGINAVIQVLGIPILLKYWGVNYYGEWLILFTIPSYIAMSDMGLGTSTTSELSMLVERGKDEEAMNILRNTFWFILTVGLIPFLLLLLSVMVLPWYDWLNFTEISPREFTASFFLLILYIYLALFLTLPLGYYRVQKIYHRERYISALFRVIEFLLIVLAIVAGFKAIMVAFIYLFIRLLQFVFVIYDLSIKFESFRLLPFKMEFKSIKHLLKPGLSTMTIYMGQNLIVQGLVTIIGIGLGSAYVVLFTVTRTLVNMVKQVVGVINLSITSEFSYAFGAKDYALLRKLFNGANKWNAVMAISLLLMLYIFGQDILQLWTKGKVVLVEPFFLFILLGTFINTIWNIRLVLLVSTNQLGYTGIAFLIGAVILVCSNILLIKQFGINGVAASIIFFEVAMLVVMWIVSQRILHPVNESLSS